MGMKSNVGIRPRFIWAIIWFASVVGADTFQTEEPRRGFGQGTEVRLFDCIFSCYR
jgi:hypothetical protein